MSVEEKETGVRVNPKTKAFISVHKKTGSSSEEKNKNRGAKNFLIIDQ